MSFSRRLEEVMAREGGSMEERNLEVLEQRAERALEKAEQGWRDFAKAMREIKESEAHREAGYRYFQPYYRDRWARRTGRTFSTLESNLKSLRYVEEMESVVQGRDVDLPMPGPIVARDLRYELSDPAARVEAWEHHLESGRSTGRNREGLRESIKEYKGESTVGEVLGDDWHVGLPEPGLKPEQKVPTQLGSFHTFVYRLNPEAVVDAVQEMQTSPDLSGEIKTVDSLLAWLESYRSALVSRQATPLRAVKGGEK